MPLATGYSRRISCVVVATFVRLVKLCHESVKLCYFVVVAFEKVCFQKYLIVHLCICFLFSLLLHAVKFSSPFFFLRNFQSSSCRSLAQFFRNAHLSYSFTSLAWDQAVENILGTFEKVSFFASAGTGLKQMTKIVLL